MKRKTPDKKLPNLHEMARALDVSVPWLKEMMRRHEDFPVEVVGSKSRAWGFDPAKVKPFWAEHCQHRPNGKSDNVEDLSPAKHKAFWEGERIKDQVGLSRSELYQARPTDALWAAGYSDVRKEMSQYPLVLAKALGMSRADRLEAERLMTEKLNALAARFQDAKYQKRLIKAAS